MPQPHVVPLSKSQHAKLTFAPLEDYSSFASMTAMPLLPFEVQEAATCFAIVFPTSGSAIPHALLGLGTTNIFVDPKGRWTAPYVPLFAASYPFSLIRVAAPDPANPQIAADANLPEVILAFDENAPHFSQPKGEALYENGEPSPLLQRITRTLGNQHQAHKEREQSLAELNLSTVIHTQNVTLHRAGKANNVSGLRMADQQKVLALPEATLGRWVKNGLMQMLYAHWGSMRHLQALLDDPSCVVPAAATNGAAHTA